jgi:hypothetical protein
LNPLIVFGLIQGLVTLVSKFMDGRKTKTGVAVALAGGALPVLSVFGVDVTPEGITSVVTQVLALFQLSLVTDAQTAAQSVFGGLLSAIGSGIALYGYYKKGQLVVKK